MLKAGMNYYRRIRQLGFGGTVQLVWSRATKLFFYLYEKSLYQLKSIRFNKHSWSKVDQQIKNDFLSTSLDEQERYNKLFSYLITGLGYYASSDFSYVYYPGAISTHGHEVDAMEGFCRIMPMIGAWIHSGRPTKIHDFWGKEVNLLEFAKKGLIAGTNPQSKGFWGFIGDRDQRIVEASDVALSIWLLRDHLWSDLSMREKNLISKWLLSANGKYIHDNNYQLFPVMINEVLLSLGYPGDISLSRKHYERLKSFYRGNGWFSDGPNGEFDYYNAWCIHYSLFWINLINPKLDSDFISEALNDFVRSYKYFFSTKGFPIMGRSICYRMATPFPLVAAATLQLDSIDPGVARRILDCVWKYFVRKDALRLGTITQGYWHKDAFLLENYSGPGSSHWSTRSLTIAFYNPPNAKFWVGPQGKMPVEKEDYSIFIPEIQWEVRGSKLTKEVQIIKINNAGNLYQGEKNRTLLNRFFISGLGLPYRSEDRYNRYKLYRYSSLYPYWESTPKQ